MHCLRRNVDIKIIMFNNRIYGLTKGQYSPTSEVGKVTKSTPQGSADQPVDPAAFALGANGSFVARAVDVEAPLLTDVLRRAAKHRGTAFMEVYQNCNVFNDGAFDAFRGKGGKDHQLIVEHGKPLVFGAKNDKGLRLNRRSMALEVVEVGDDPEKADILVHDETNPVLAYMLTTMRFGEFPVALGVLYAQDRATYDETLQKQQQDAIQSRGRGDLAALLSSGSTWQV
jgi:2-oxoglutarate ferredoxin oxidoreductase subunit beta